MTTDDDRPTPSDYDADDGLQDNLLEKCPHCDCQLGGAAAYMGPVYDSDGTEYKYITATDPADRPFFCANCWPELEANRRKAKNTSLTEYQ